MELAVYRDTWREDDPHANFKVEAAAYRVADPFHWVHWAQNRQRRDLPITTSIIYNRANRISIVKVRQPLGSVAHNGGSPVKLFDVLLCRKRQPQHT